MSRLSPSSVVGYSAAVLIALATAAAFAQTAPTGATSDPKAAQATRSMKPLTPQGPLASKPAPSVMSPDSRSLATRPLPAATTPPPAASTQAPAAPTSAAKKCGERKGDC